MNIYMNQFTISSFVLFLLGVLLKNQKILKATESQSPGALGTSFCKKNGRRVLIFEPKRLETFIEVLVGNLDCFFFPLILFEF